MPWRTTPLTMPDFMEDADLPADLTKIEGFAHYAQDLSLDVEIGGGVELQRVGANGTWETFETVLQPAEQVMVANRPAIRIVPIGGCSYRISWM